MRSPLRRCEPSSSSSPFEDSGITREEFLDGQGEFHDVDAITPSALDPMAEFRRMQAKSRN